MNPLVLDANRQQAAEPLGCRDFPFAIAAGKPQVQEAGHSVPFTRGPRKIPTPSLYLRPDLMVGPQLFPLVWRRDERRAADADAFGCAGMILPLAFHGFAIDFRAIRNANGGSFPCAKPRFFFSSPASLSRAACRPTVSALWQAPVQARSSQTRPTTTSSPVRRLVRSQALIATTRASAPAPTKDIRAGLTARHRYSTAIGACRPGGGFSFVSHHEHDKRGGGMPLPRRKGRA